MKWIALTQAKSLNISFRHIEVGNFVLFAPDHRHIVEVTDSIHRAEELRQRWVERWEKSFEILLVLNDG